VGEVGEEASKTGSSEVVAPFMVTCNAGVCVCVCVCVCVGPVVKVDTIGEAGSGILWGNNND